MRGLHARRITVGVFIGHITSPFYRAIIQGINDAAKEHDVNVIFFAGGVINPPDNVRHRNLVYNLINRDVVDGIIYSSALFRYLKPAELKEFLNRYAGIPAVNIGSGIEGIPSVIADVEAGMAKLMHHLVDDHGYRKIAMIRGLQYHHDSELRYKVYRKLLDQYEIPFREDLVVAVDPVNNGGRVAVAKLDKQCGLDCDVITVVGDQMVVRVVKALQEKNYRIPEDVRVVGLQGVSDGQFFDPPLTIVDDNVYIQGKVGLENLLRLIRGESVPMIQAEPTELVIRRSCGCPENGEERVKIDFPPGVPLEKILHQNRNEILIQMNRAVVENSLIHRSQLKPENVEPLLDALEACLRGEPHHVFLDAVDKVLLKVSTSRYNLLPWIGALLALYRFPRFQLNPEQEEEWKVLWAPILNRMNQLQGKALRMQEDGFIHLTETFRMVAETLFSDYQMESFLEKLSEAADIENCYIVMYENQTPGGLGSLAGFYSKNRTFYPSADEVKFPVKQFLPPGVLPDNQRFSMVVQSLYSGSIDFGYIVNSMDVPELGFYTAIQTQLSGAINNQYQLQKLRAAEKRFSDIAYSTSDWLWETDENGRFTYCSGGVHEVLGYYAHEMVGRTIFDFLAPSEAAYREYLQDELFRKKAPIRNLEIWNLHKNGQLVGLLISGTPVFTNEGKFLGYRGLYRDITERKKAEEEIRRMAYYDRLTGLPNRTFLMNHLENTLKRMEKGPEMLAVLFIDLDRFKNVNDNLGHDVGDRLLQQVAERLKKSIRQGKDILARLGGDEFIVLLNECHSREIIVEVCQRIFENLEEPFNLNGYYFFVTCSIGIAIYPEDGTNVQMLMKNADTAMYRSKNHGRNRFAFYDPDMELISIAEMQLENNLHRALERGEFFLEYQPQVNAFSGELIGLEALVRWNSPELGAVPSTRFIPIAEESGLIIPIGEWVLKTVVEQMVAWKKEGLPLLRVSVNVSATQIRNGNLAEVCTAIVREAGLDPSLLELEITESAFMGDDALIFETLQTLKEAGFSIALDDFGTGYSSLSSLKHFPLDTVKIDQSFIKDLTTDPVSNGIVSAIILMVRTLKLRAVAEGVETKEQLEELRKYQCEGIQGYLFSQPLSAEKIADLLQNRESMAVLVRES